MIISASSKGQADVDIVSYLPSASSWEEMI